TNTGSGDVMSPWADRLYLSKKPQIDGTARVLGEVDYNTPLAAGAAAPPASVNFTLPLDLSGDYYFVVVSDVLGQVNHGTPLTALQPVHIQLGPYADLAVSNIEAPAQTIGDPARVTIRWTVQNVGTGTSQTPHWVDQVIASPTTDPDAY